MSGAPNANEPQGEPRDCIVVGSGATGAMAAQTLAEAGARVAMLDVGERDGVYKDLIPKGLDFRAVRETDPDQHRYFLGDRFEGVPWGATRVGAQLTPPRQHLTRGVEQWIPIFSGAFEPMQSLAYGGLGAGWGLNCYAFSAPEIEALGLRAEDLAGAYETVARRIGIAATRDDDGAPYGLGGVRSLDPPLRMDDAMQAIMGRYGRVKPRLAALGFAVGQTPSAILTRDRPGEGRSAYAYGDMDFWSDEGLSAYRPWITVDRLRREGKLEYLGGRLVLDFREIPEGEAGGAKAGGETGCGGLVAVRARRVDTGEDETFLARRLVLAAGALGTARIALRSFRESRAGGPSGAAGRAPVLCSPYTYIPAIQWRRLGKPLPRRKTSMSQLTIYHDATGDGSDVAIGCLYTYRSLLLHKLVKEAPLDMADALAIMRALQSSFVIAGVFHPDRPGPNKFLELRPDPSSATGDRLDATFRLTPEEAAAVLARDKAYCRALRMLGCLPIKRIDPGLGSSIHYAGTLPYDDDNASDGGAGGQSVGQSASQSSAGTGQEGPATEKRQGPIASERQEPLDAERPLTLARDGRLHGTRGVYVADGSGFRYLPGKGLTFTLMANAHRVAAGLGAGNAATS